MENKPQKFNFLLNCSEIRILRLMTESSPNKSMPRNLLSDFTGVDVNTIRRMETESDFNPGVFTLAKIANFFNVSLDSLLVKKKAKS